MNAHLKTADSGDDNKQMLRNLYNNYGAKLYGFIFEIVKDQNIAEQYFVELFNEISKSIEQHPLNGSNTLVRLQLMARKKLVPFFDGLRDCAGPHVVKSHAAVGNNKYVNGMSNEERQVFCGLHYHGKTTAMLAAELNKPEHEIRQILKGSFNSIRKHNGYTGLH
jgi:DNA-directed RNA polymerase specialized sigma24 family protein